MSHQHGERDSAKISSFSDDGLGGEHETTIHQLGCHVMVPKHSNTTTTIVAKEEVEKEMMEEME